MKPKTLGHSQNVLKYIELPSNERHYNLLPTCLISIYTLT